jgi:cold shock CspA family protein
VRLFKASEVRFQRVFTIISITLFNIKQDKNMAKGIIKRYAFRKGFGFIVDDKSGDEFFFHKSEWEGDGPIKQGISVKFVGKDSDKGPQAESVVPLDGGKSNPSSNKRDSKPASLEERVTSLESSATTLKLVSILALIGVIALVAERFL